jgi:hypothetical protein
VTSDQLAVQTTRVPQYKQVWKAGFPPKTVYSPLTELPNAAPISSVLADRDVIILEAASAAELQPAIDRDEALDAEAGAGGHEHGSAGGGAAPAMPQSGHSTAAGATEMQQRGCDAASPSSGASPPVLRTQGAAAGTYAHPTTSLPLAAAAQRSGPTAKRRKKADFPGIARTLADEGPACADEVEAMQRAEDGVLGALLQSARGGKDLGGLLGADWSPGNKSLFKALRGDLRDARSARNREATASAQISAVRAGQVRDAQIAQQLGFLAGA